MTEKDYMKRGYLKLKHLMSQHAKTYSRQPSQIDVLKMSIHFNTNCFLYGHKIRIHTG